MYVISGSIYARAVIKCHSAPFLMAAKTTNTFYDRLTSAQPFLYLSIKRSEADKGVTSLNKVEILNTFFPHKILQNTRGLNLTAEVCQDQPAVVQY